MLDSFKMFGVGLILVLLFAMLVQCAGCADQRGVSWDQETLQKNAGTMVCADRNFVFGTDEHGNLRECQ